MASSQSAGLRHAFFAERAVGKVPGVDRNTPVRELNSVAIIGAGTMGAGIAYNCLTSGMAVTLLDNSDDGLERGANTIRGLYAGGVERGKISEDDMQAGLGRFETSQDYANISGVDSRIRIVSPVTGFSRISSAILQPPSGYITVTCAAWDCAQLSYTVPKLRWATLSKRGRHARRR